MMMSPTVLKEVHPFTDDKAVTGAETLLLSAGDKQQVLQAWQGFVLSGFERLWFEEALHRFMVEHCHFRSTRNRTEFWELYFNSGLRRLLALLNQLGGAGTGAVSRRAPRRGGAVRRPTSSWQCVSIRPACTPRCFRC